MISDAVVMNRGWSYREQVGPDSAGHTVLSYLAATRLHSTELEWAARIDTEAYRVLESQTTKHYSTTVLPTMGVGATDMSNLRAKGIECYGIGPALDTEDGPKGFGAHSDQERILESELHRFVRFQYAVVLELARTR